MRRNFRLLLSALVIGGAAFSCVEPEVQTQDEFSHFIVSAESVEDGDVTFGKKWVKGDQIAIWNGQTNQVIETSQANSGATAMFLGKVENTGNFLVSYPASETGNGSDLSFTLPADQTAVKDGAADDVYALAGKGNSNNVTVLNMVGFLSISTERENIKAIRFETKSGADVAGDYTVSASDMSVSVTNGEKAITLKGNNGSVLEVGTYYFAVLPQNVNGYKVSFTDDNGNVTEMTSDNTVEVKAGKVASLGDDAFLNASLAVECEQTEVYQKGDQIVINVDSGNAGWTYELSSGCDWLTEVNKTDTELVYELNRIHLTSEEYTAEITVTNDLNTALKEVVSVKLASHLLFDARFREDGTAYDASKYEHQISTITGDYMYTYFNKTANRYVARFNCTTPGGGRATSYYKFDYGNNTDFKNRIADNHTIECLCMMDQALDGVYDYEIKPFSSMQSGGTGFVVGKKNNANKLFFLPNTGSWTFADTKIVMEEGVYYHLVGTFDAASKETKVYVNGKLYGTFTNSSTTFKHASATSQWFAIGGDPNGATNCGDGWRGDVVTSKIYDNVLSQEEVDVLWKEANMGLPYSTVKYDVVLFGDSITQYWMSPVRGNPTFFTDNNWYNRGISGNTTADMLARFNYDLEQLAPKVMVFCGGTNDIAQNDGVFVSNEEILENIKTMVTRAEAVGTTVILCSLLPANAYYWSTAIENPSQEIIKVNELIKAYANEKGITYVDYWTPLHDETNGLPEKYTSDGVHPNKECYTIMQNILKPIVTDVLSKIK